MKQLSPVMVYVTFPHGVFGKRNRLVGVGAF
jgi:hypothetical protein